MSVLSLFPRLLLAMAIFTVTFGAHARTPRLIGYVTNGTPANTVSVEKLDAINFAFGQVQTDGTVYFPNDTAPAHLHALVARRADNPSLQILLSLGGWTAGNFSEAVSTPAARAQFVQSTVEMIERFDLDGIDIDWEYPGLGDAGISHSPDDRRNFTLLLEAMRARLDSEGAKKSRKYLVTLAVAEGRFAEGLEFPRIAAALDWINLMTYDFYGSLTPTTGHQSGFTRSSLAPADARTTVDAVQYFLDVGMPAGKINIGVPFYGRHFGDVEPAHQGRFQPFASEGGYIVWHQIVHTRLGVPGWERHWDEDAQVPFLWNPVERRFITYDDPQSLAIKAEYVKQHGLGGMMYWEHKLDDHDQLLDILHHALHTSAK